MFICIYVDMSVYGYVCIWIYVYVDMCVCGYVDDEKRGALDVMGMSLIFDEL